MNVTVSPAPTVEVADGVPDPNSRLTPAQIAQLKSRLELLRVGMTRTKVLEILNLSSFNVRYYAHAHPTGLTYRLEHGHTLTLAMAAGDYEVTLRWARFDGEVWPKNGVDSRALKPHSAGPAN